MTRTTHFAAIVAALLLTVLTFQQTVAVPHTASPVIDARLA